MDELTGAEKRRLQCIYVINRFIFSVKDIKIEPLDLEKITHFDQNYEKKFFIFSFMKNRSPPWGQMFEKK